MFDRSLLEEAWEHARTGGEAPGLDGISPRTFECDLSANLDALYNDLASNTYRPQAYRVVYVPKESGGQRRLVIATVRDRVAMTAVTMLLQALIAPLLHPCSFAYRAGVGVRDALAMVCSYRDRGFAHALRADVERFFDTVQHAPLFAMLEAAHAPRDVLNLIRLWLSAPLADRDRLISLTEGLPQGLPISPLLANLYLTPFDRSMVEAGWKLVRYADDFVVCCVDDATAQKARGEAERALASLGLRLAADKTSVSTFDAGFPFLGATLIGTELIYDAPHPYEADYRPPHPPPHRPPSQGLPYTLLRTLYIQQQGSILACHGGRLVVSRDGTTLIDLPAHHIDQIFTFGRVHLTSGVMGFCLRKGIPIHLFSGRGSYYGLLHQLQDDDGAPMVRRQQYRLADDEQKRLGTAKAIVDANCAIPTSFCHTTTETTRKSRWPMSLNASKRCTRASTIVRTTTLSAASRAVRRQRTSKATPSASGTDSPSTTAIAIPRSTPSTAC